jgi:hypothetical protein
MAWQDWNFAPVFPEKEGEKTDATRRVINKAQHEQLNPPFALLAPTARSCPTTFHVTFESN